jgi:hypothetical protein
LLVGFGIVFVGLVVIGALVASISYYSSGWNLLRTHYATGITPLALELSFQSATFCTPYNLDGLFGSFRSCLKFGYSKQGFYMVGIFPLGFIFKPVLAPWDDLSLSRLEGKAIAFSRVP